MARPKVSKAVDLVVEAVEDRGSEAAKVVESATKEARFTMGGGFKRMSAGANSELKEVIPSGIDVLNRYVLGIGGWPVKRTCEIFSDPSAGKTSLLADALGSCARLGGIPALVETESALEPARFKVLGCNLDDVWLSEPMTVEEAVEAQIYALKAMTTTAGPNMLGWDSLAMSQLKAVFDDKKGKDGKSASTMGRRAALIAEKMPVIVRLVTEKRCAHIIINQVRTKLNVRFGDPSTTPGGDITKFASSIRLRLWAGSKVKVGDAAVGIMPTITTVKSKLAIPHRKAKLRMMFETGWDNNWPTLNLAKTLKLVPDGLKLTDDNVLRARAALSWYTPTPEQVAAWAAIDEKQKRGKQKAEAAAEEEDVADALDEFTPDEDEDAEW